MMHNDSYPNSGTVFGGSWWTVGNGAQVRLEPDGERRWIEPDEDDLIAMLRAVGVDLPAVVSGLTGEVAALRATVERMRDVYLTGARAVVALQRIADMPTEPRPDGTFNYSREALIDIAREATRAE